MKTTKTVQMALMAVALWLAGGARAAEVKHVTAEYAWPWGVEIRYEVVGTLDPANILAVKATDRTNNKTYTATADTLSGDTGRNAGSHTVRWDLDKQGVKIQSSNVVFTVEYSPALYCVIDFSGGTNATSYSTTWMNEPPNGGFNTDVYKTTKLVLRWIPAGSFTMGSPSSETGRERDESQHKVTLSKSYYIGLFEVTQKQYQLVMGSNPSRFWFVGDKGPVEQVSWNMIRGNTDWPASSAVSADSFMGRLRARTGLAFDLPTEAQWEYACRAGTTTAYSYGDSENGEYMRYSSNSLKQTYDVGAKKANPWGLYDMHGNVYEWCLDWYTSNLGTAAVTDPKGASSGSARVLRGGCWFAEAVHCRSAYRCYYNPSDTYYERAGFRLARILSE